MRNGQPDHEQLVRYLLGELPEEECRRLEQECLDDDSVFEHLQAAEAELTDDYVRGDLRGARRIQFEERVRRGSDVELSKLLTGVKAQRRPRWNAGRILAMAASLAVATVGGWFAITQLAGHKTIETAQQVQPKPVVPVPPSLAEKAPVLSDLSPPANDKRADAPTSSRQQAQSAAPIASVRRDLEKPAMGGVVPTSRARISAQTQAMTAPAAPAAAAGGSITGVVKDASGAAIASAEVVARNTVTKAELKTMADAEGRYSFALMPYGKYDLEAHARGFLPKENKDVKLDSNGQLNADFSLSVGAATATVEVTAASAHIDTATASGVTSVQTKALTVLPRAGEAAAFKFGLGDGLTPAVEAAIGKTSGATLFEKFVDEHEHQDGTPFVVENVSTEKNLVIRFSRPVTTGVTLSDAKRALEFALGGKRLNGSLNEAAATLAEDLNRTCCGNSIRGDTIVVTRQSGLVTGALKTSRDGLKVTFTPTKPFEPNVPYSLVVRNVRDKAGRTMKSEFRATFTVSP